MKYYTKRNQTTINLDPLGAFVILLSPKYLETSARTTPHIFLGYLFGTKGYKVMNLATNKIHISMDVIFMNMFFLLLYHLKVIFFFVLKSISSPDYTELDSYKNYVNDCNNVTNTTSTHLPEHYIEHHGKKPHLTITITSPTPSNVPPTVVQRRPH